MNSLIITGATLTPGAAGRIMETAINAGTTHGMGYWAEVRYVGMLEVKPNTPKVIGFIHIREHEDSGEIDRAVAGENNGLTSSPQGQRVFTVNGETLKRAIVKIMSGGEEFGDLAGNIVRDEIDGPTAEAIIQVACFGKLVYG